MRHPASDLYSFRNPDKYGLIPMRELMRRLPGVRMDIEDIDFILRWKPPVTEFGVGRVRPIEAKEAFWDRWDQEPDDMLNRSKRMVCRAIDKGLRDQEWYDGFYVVRHTDDNHDHVTRYKVENVEMDAETFDEWVSTPESTVEGHWA